MKRILWAVSLLLGLAVPPAARSAPAPDLVSPDPAIPEPLRAWEGWVLWKADHWACPVPFDQPGEAVCTWASRLEIGASPEGERFGFDVRVFDPSWVTLPGSPELWPVEVRVGGAPVPVIARGEAPAVRLPAGSHRVEGRFRWSELPQRIRIPEAVGLLGLTLGGRPVEVPARDAEGWLWLKREAASSEAAEEFLSAKVHGVLEDGIPIWLRLELELIVGGPSREVALGQILPEGWKLASLRSSIPAAIDGEGRIKAQVRPGRWTLGIDAFRSDNPSALRFPEGVEPTVREWFLGFRSAPELRMVELGGVAAVDVTQTTMPAPWRDLPVYRWDTRAELKIEERVRGMGEQKPAGLTILRELWLDDDGAAFTFRDRIRAAVSGSGGSMRLRGCGRDRSGRAAKGSSSRATRSRGQPA